MKPGDVITSLVRPIRRLSALITEDQDGFVCSSGFAVLKPQRVPGEVLLTFLKLPIIGELLDLHTTASMYPAIAVETLIQVPFSLPSQGIIAEVETVVKEARRAHQDFKLLLVDTTHMVERSIARLL